MPIVDTQFSMDSASMGSDCVFRNHQSGGHLSDHHAAFQGQENLLFSLTEQDGAVLVTVEACLGFALQYRSEIHRKIGIDPDCTLDDRQHVVPQSHHSASMHLEAADSGSKGLTGQADIPFPQIKQNRWEPDDQLLMGQQRAVVPVSRAAHDAAAAQPRGIGDHQIGWRSLRLRQLAEELLRGSCSGQPCPSLVRAR